MKTFNLLIFKPFVTFSILFNLTSIARAIDLSTVPILPPVQTSIVAQGMGNAVIGDGTLFNASSFNPALLSKAPHTVELLQLGLNVGNDIFGMVDYLQAGNFPDPGSAFKDLVAGTDSEKTSALTSLDTFSANMLNKSVQAGAGDNISVKIPGLFGKNVSFGIQVYNNTHALAQAKAGSLISTLNSIPTPFTSASQPALDSLVGIMKTSIQTGIDETLTSSQKSMISGDITALKNGSEDLPTFKNNVQSIFQGAGESVDVDLLQRNIVDNLAQDLFYLNTLAYSDFVGMATVSFNPFEDSPLTVGLNAKLVQRYFAWDTINAGILEDLLKGNVSAGTDFINNLKQGTTRWGVDLGFLYALQDDLNLGLSFQDLIKQSASIPNLSSSNVLYGVMTDPAPIVTRMGISWHPIHELSLNSDWDDVFSTTSYYSGYDLFSHFRFGSALTLAGILQLRGGFSDNNLNGGLGLMFGFIGLDYSFAVDQLSQSYNHYGLLKIVF